MHDVAGLAGVAIATVSAYVNGFPKVGEARSARIRRAMDALDYHPDHIARSLKVGRTQTIGVVIPDITNAFYPSVFRGIEDAAREAGYSVLLCNSNENAEQERAHLNALFARRVDGVLLACASGSTAHEASLSRRFPLVFVDRLPRNLKEGAICIDNVEAGRMATQHLIDQGHRRIALLAGDLNLSPHADRLEGFRQAMSRHRLPVREEYLWAGGMRVEDGQRSAAEFFELRERPTAIIASNSKLLLGLLRAARALQVECPRDVSIVSFDEQEWNEALHPQITSIVQPTYEIGRQAFDLLLRRLNSKGGGTGTGITRLRALLRIHESTAALNGS